MISGMAGVYKASVWTASAVRSGKSLQRRRRASWSSRMIRRLLGSRRVHLQEVAIGRGTGMCKTLGGLKPLGVFGEM